MSEILDYSCYKHLLVIVPHQDDEILLCAGLIYEFLKAQKKVTVCVVTNGDFECKDYSKGRGRLCETLAGLALLGVEQENIIFLGYADTGMAREDSFLMKLYEASNGEEIYPSITSNKTYGLEEKEDFHFLCYGEHGGYNRNTLMTDLREVFLRRNPDVIVTTHGSDLHGDHEALFYFVSEILSNIEKKERPQLLVGIVHSTEGDEEWPKREGKKYTCPKGLEETGLSWEERLILPLSKELRGGKRKGNLKYEALLKYKIALEPGAIDYLMSFIKEEEIFWKIS